MSKRLAVVRSGSGDPLRAGLANAIKESAAARRRLDEHDAAIVRGRQRVAAAETALERATAAVVAARDEHSGLIAEAIGEARELPGSAAVQAAISGEADARIALDQTRAGLAKLQADRRAREIDAALRDCDVIVERNRVVGERTAELITAAEAAERILQRNVAVLRALCEQADVARIPDDADVPWQRRNALNDEMMSPVPPALRERLGHLLRGRLGFASQYDVPADVSALARQWREVRTKLRSDPNATLPTEE